MMNNHHEVIIQGNDRFVGTGHTSELVEDDAGNTWVLYHAVDKNNPQGRVLMLDEVQWQEGWPVVEGNTPSKEWKLPEFNE
jgi:arabinan endo-1,5-alpha-L-arabinosidase